MNEKIAFMRLQEKLSEAARKVKVVPVRVNKNQKERDEIYNCDSHRQPKPDHLPYWPMRGSVC